MNSSAMLAFEHVPIRQGSLLAEKKAYNFWYFFGKLSQDEVAAKP